jgi:putative PIG3 family NAD(P)H quinone oxidoreductase
MECRPQVDLCKLPNPNANLDKNVWKKRKKKRSPTNEAVGAFTCTEVEQTSQLAPAKSSMKAIVIDQPGDETVLKLGEAPDPTPGPNDLLIKIKCAGLNRADIMQRQGFYPPPPGASTILGMESSGDVIAIGPQVKGWRVGDRAMALLPGGGYAEKVAVDSGSVMKIPASLTYEEAAALPEVFLTAFLNIFILASVQHGEAVLIHGGGSGVGTASIILLREFGARAIVTAGSDAKCEQCLRLGADVAINYKTGPFVDRVKTVTSGKGADIILDSIGAAYLDQNVQSLAAGGRLVLIGLMKGNRGEIDLLPVLRNHLKIFGSTLRSRSASEKAKIVSEFLSSFGPALEVGRIRPQIHVVLPLNEAAQAHRIMQASEHFGKIVLRVS